MYPSLDAGVDIKHSNSYYENSNTVSASLRAGYEIDIWGRLDDLREASIYDEYRSRFDRQAMTVAITAMMVNEWYGFGYTRSYIRYLERKIALAKKEVELLRQRYRTRQAGIVDLLSQESALKQMESELESMELQEHGHCSAIALLLGENVEKFSCEGPETLPDVDGLSTPVIESRHILARPDIAAALATLKAQDRRAAAAVSAQYPRFSLSASAGESDMRFSDLFENWYTSISASLVAPLFDGGSRDADARMALERRNESLLILKKLFTDASVEVSDALKAIETGRRNYKTLHKQLSIDEKRVAGYRSGYLHGTEDFKRYLDAKMTLISTQQKVLRAKLDLINAYVALQRSTASGWEPVDRVWSAERRE